MAALNMKQQMYAQSKQAVNDLIKRDLLANWYDVTVASALTPLPRDEILIRLNISKYLSTKN